MLLSIVFPSIFAFQQYIIKSLNQISTEIKMQQLYLKCYCANHSKNLTLFLDLDYFLFNIMG